MSIRVLIVDDNRDTLRAYTKALQRKIKMIGRDRNSMEGSPLSLLEVENADTITLAREKLKAKPFDILIVDLKIPGPSGEEMGGLVLISESLRLDPLRPIVVITGYGSVELARQTLTQGVFDFIEKSATAVDDLINVVQRAIDHSDEKMRRAGNPFTPMTGVEPTVFGGRTKELEFFEQRINRSLHTKFREHFLVLGDWGIGKSTLLKEYKRICQSRGHIASIVPLEALQSGTTLIEAARSIVEGIFRDLPYSIDQFKKVASFFDSVGISVLGTGLQFKRDTSKREMSTQAFLHDTLVRLWQDLESKTDVFIILLDDLDNFMAASEIVMTLRQTLSMESIRKTNILVGIASTPNTWLELTAVNKHHPLARYFLSRVELDPLSESEVRETVLNSLADTGISFSTEVLNRVVEYTEGHPYEMQVLCFHLFNNQLSRRVEIEVWDKALQAALNDLGMAVFDQWFNQASSEEAKILRVIAESETPMPVKDIHSRAAAGKVKVSAGNIAKYVQRLAEKKLISKSGRGMYTLSDRMFRSYVLNRPD
ncbi:MAG: response regulator [Blastocatellia bacterium]|nr:response regulator [Blastocatellia bacterium]